MQKESNLTGNEKENCVVLGAGVIGVLTAFRLQSSGINVTLVDRDEPSMGCSYGNCGLLATDEIFPMPSPSLILQIPGMLLNPNGPLVIKPSFFLPFLPWAFKFLWNCRRSKHNEGMIALKNLNKTALSDWREILKETSSERFLNTNGNLHVYKSEKGLSEGRDDLETLKKHDIPAELISNGKLKEMVPGITDEQYGAMHYLDTGRSLEPYGMVKAIFDKFMNNGGTFLKADIKAIEKQEDHVTLLFDDQRLKAEKIVIACGYKSEKFANQVGLNAPLTAERGYHIMIPEPGISTEYALTHHERRFVITPMDHGIRLAGTVEFARGEDKPTLKRARMLVNFAQELLPGLSSDAKNEWVGSRPTLPDYLPVIDKVDNIYFAFGHNHLGLTQAATTAKAINQMMGGETPSFIRETNHRNPFSINRF